ncbi:hypothetical protein [Methylophaga sp. OBS1]|uniref:hypothetical protein n=1 Tax=Methylophaga sp. OBS1 TaxID=2991933 RepID=UPI002253B552|nr:hypothetical protein [Methylophaga sp. OBS1]
MKCSNWLLIVSISFLSMSVKAEPSKDALIGTWYANIHTSMSESTMWLLQLREDNSYLSQKMLCQTKKLIWVDETTGTWKLDKTTLIQMPKTHSDFNKYEETDSGEMITFTDVTVSEDSLSYKDTNQKKLTFKRYDGFFRMRCSGLM